MESDGWDEEDGEGAGRGPQGAWTLITLLAGAPPPPPSAVHTGDRQISCCRPARDPSLQRALDKKRRRWAPESRSMASPTTLLAQRQGACGRLAAQRRARAGRDSRGGVAGRVLGAGAGGAAVAATGRDAGRGRGRVPDAGGETRWSNAALVKSSTGQQQYWSTAVLVKYRWKRLGPGQRSRLAEGRMYRRGKAAPARV